MAGFYLAEVTRGRVRGVVGCFFLFSMAGFYIAEVTGMRHSGTSCLFFIYNSWFLPYGYG